MDNAKEKIENREADNLPKKNGEKLKTPAKTLAQKKKKIINSMATKKPLLGQKLE